MNAAIVNGIRTNQTVVNAPSARSHTSNKHMDSIAVQVNTITYTDEVVVAHQARDERMRARRMCLVRLSDHKERWCGVEVPQRRTVGWRSAA